MPEFGQGLAERRRLAIAMVQERVGTARRRYITAIPGQEMIYQAKEGEAIRYVAASPEPADLTDYPMLAAEVGITAPTAHELAQVWLGMAHLWRQVAAVLEAARLTANADIAAAPSIAAIAAILDTLQAQIAALQTPQETPNG